MVTALSGSAAVSSTPAVSPPPPPVASTAASSNNRASAPDTVTISPQAQQTYKASQDVDRDGDSH